MDSPKQSTKQLPCTSDASLVIALERGLIGYHGLNMFIIQHITQRYALLPSMLFMAGLHLN